ncbi:AI-2E family transporter [Bernardetia sp.]|uniref:AI-2E family transporter n=1 Tax=Bernardetia sp. TaxID=1937974 RepID=UPI0025C0ACAC|nr:AI-2E family transporter [Bernardetia sp.]
MIRRLVIFYFIVLPIIAVLGTFAWFFSTIVGYFVVAMVFSAILQTPTNYLSQIQIAGIQLPRVMAVLLSFVIFAGIVALFVLLFIPLISEQIKFISALDYNSLFNTIISPIDYIEGFLIERNWVKEEKGFLMTELQKYFLDFFTDLKFGNVLSQILDTTSNIFVGTLSVFFISFFLLYEKGLFKRGIISLIPNAYFEVSISAVSKIEKLLSNYLFGLLIQMFSIFTLVSIGLIVSEVKYAVTIAIFAAVANLIPYIGPILGASFGLIVSLSTLLQQNQDTDFSILAIKVIIVFLIVQFSDNLLLQPIIFSRSVKAHPLEIFSVVFMGAALAGAVGMILAIPVYTILRVTALEFWKGYKEYRIFKTRYYKPRTANHELQNNGISNTTN